MAIRPGLQQSRAEPGGAAERARRGDEVRRRSQWLQASTEITRQLLSEHGEEPLRVIARRLQEIADADAVNVVLPTGDGERLTVEVATGAGERELAALSYPVRGTVSELVLTTGLPVLIDDIALEHDRTVHLSDAVDVGPLMALPLVGTERVRGALVVGRLAGRDRFTEADLEMATTFANHAAVALELADARAAREQLLLLQDRDRIARDLHDHVIQRLFGTGLSIESVAAALRDDPRAARLRGVVEDVDETIRQIRTSIFALRGPLGPGGDGVRHQLLAVAAEATPLLGFAPHVRFSGPVDALVPDGLLDELVAVVREALSNVARHAGASTCSVRVSADTEAVRVAVTDDGSGLGPGLRRSGLANLHERAVVLGGEFAITSTEGAGTQVSWSAPLA